MDTDIPPLLPAILPLLQVQLTPAAIALLIVGVAFAALDALIAAAALLGIWTRELSRAEGWRTVLGKAVAKVVAVAALSFALYEVYQPALAPGLARAGLGPGAMVLTVVGATLLLELLFAGTLAALLIAAGRRGVSIIPQGAMLAAWLTAWLPRRENGGNGEPEFEITLAGGEQVEEEEREYIENILELGETPVREVMKPRPDVLALDVQWQAERIIAEVAASRYSRFPVYEDGIDDIIGVLHLRDLFAQLARGGNGDLDLRRLLQEPYFMPDSKKVDDALRDLQRTKSHLAVVIDEYGGTAGIVTIEDLLEEIVGEIQDEYDIEAKQIHQRDDGSWVVSASLPLDDLNELLNVELQAEDVDTVGGYIVNALGRIPSPQDALEEDGLRFTVLSVERKRIGRVRIERVAEDAP